jgi:hypothetical protein
MKLAKSICIIGLTAMSLVLLYGFIFGNFFVEGSKLLQMPWGIVSMIDLYIGFILFSAWIVFREKASLPSWIWVALMMVLGFWTASLYVLLALNKSKGNWIKFWMGRRID